MLDNPVWRMATSGLFGLVSVVVVGVCAVLVSKSTQHSPASVPPVSLQVVDGDCAAGLESLEIEVAALSVQIAERKRTISGFKTAYVKEFGDPVQVPEVLADNQVASNFRAAMEGIAEKKSVTLLIVVCGQYPCVAVFQGRRAGFMAGLRGAIRAERFSWSARWVAEGVAVHKEGERHFAAVRFFPKDQANPAQVRYLERGVEQAILTAMSGTAPEPTDR